MLINYYQPNIPKSLNFYQFSLNKFRYKKYSINHQVSKSVVAPKLYQFNYFLLIISTSSTFRSIYDNFNELNKMFKIYYLLLK